MSDMISEIQVSHTEYNITLILLQSGFHDKQPKIDSITALLNNSVILPMNSLQLGPMSTN